jgi:hypothetical protein
MGKAFWPAGKASIILLPSGSQGESLLALSKSWAEAGLLGPAFWIKPEDVEINENQPPAITATVLGVNSDRTVVEIQVDLFEQLARENLAVVRLVKLRAATAGRESDQLQDSIVGEIEAYLGWSMPSSDSRASDKEAVLDYQPVNLICVPTEFKAESKEQWARMRNGTTVIAAPEDRSSPWSTDAFVRNDERFEGFTLMHLATVSGIWTGLPVGTLEMFDRERSGMHQVWISRVFYSGVFTDGLARRVAAGFIEDVASPHFEALAPPSDTAFIDSIYEQDYISAMVQSAFLIDESTLDYRRPEMPGDPLKEKIGAFRQLFDFMGFLAKKLSQIPKWIWLSIRRRVSKKVEKTLQGNTGSKEIGVGLEDQLDIYDRVILSNWSRVEVDQQTARESLLAPVKLSQVKTSHSLWQQLRELIFGSLDGGYDLRWAGFPLLDDDRRPIFEGPASLFPITEASWEPASPLPEAIATLVSQKKVSVGGLVIALEESVQAANADQNTLRIKQEGFSGLLEELRAQKHDLWDQLATNGGLKISASGEEVPINLTEANAWQKKYASSTADESDLDQASGFDLPLAIRNLKKLQADLKACELELAAATKDLNLLEITLSSAAANLESARSFQAEVEKTFQARFSEAMDSKLRQAADDLQTLELAIENLQAPDLGRLVKLRKAFHKALGITTLIAFSLFAIYAFIYLNLEEQVQRSWPTLLESSLWGFGALLIFVIGFGTSYYRGWSQLQRAVTLLHADINRVISGHRSARSEENRLGALYAQAEDWMSLLRLAILEPWRVRESWKKSNLRSLDIEKLPFSMRVAQAQDDQEAPLYVLRSAAAKQIYVRGWRAKAFEMLISEVARMSGKGGSFKVDSLDRDLPHASTGARNLMLDFMGREVVLERVAARQIKPLIEKLQGETMSTARPKVMEVDTDPLSPIRTDPDSVLEYEAEQEWSEFLSRSIVLEDGTPSPTTPISALALGEAYIQSGEHEGVRAHILLPQRIVRELPTGDARSVSIYPYKEETPAPVDSVIRVDIVGPLDLSVTRLMSKEEVVSASTNVGEDEIKIRGKLFE